MVTRKAIYTWKLSWILLLNILHSNVDAGPAKRSGRMTREVYPEIESENDGSQAQVCIVGDVVYAVDELVPAEQPCLKCRCQPPGVQCETVRCVKKSGCKAIHRPNKCCPDYQCECYHEEKTYANGERLKTPLGGECKVCYCRGGEIQCAEVSCYIRSDCEGKTVPGQCCPKYDHCPPIDPLLGRPTTVTTNATLPNKQVLELWPPTKPTHNTTYDDTPDANKIETATLQNVKITKSTEIDFTDDSIKQIDQPKITIHEIIPEIKEIPMTAPSNQNTLISEEPEDLLDNNNNNNNNNNAVTDPEPDSSEISEVFQQPPPVLRIGDKLLFLKQGELVPEKDASTPTSVITIIGAEGLQRGFEDSAEVHEVLVQNYGEHALFNNNSNDLEPKTSESTHILSLVKKKSTPATTTERNVDHLLDVGDKFDNSPVDDSKSTNLSTELMEVTEPTKILILQIDNMEDDNNTTRSNYEPPLEENPAYPALPEVLSSQNAENYQHTDQHLQKTTAIKKTLETTFEEENNGTISQNTTLDSVTTENVSEKATLKLDDEVNVTTEEITTSNTLSETIDITASTSSEEKHSMESIEETTEDSGENTTPKNDHASIVSDENASVEPLEAGTLESVDMLSDPNPTSFLHIDDIERVQNKTEEEHITPTVKDVEMISVDNLTHIDIDVKSDKMVLPIKTLDKRESSLRDEADEVFKELEAELNADSTEKTQTIEEEREESDRIFQELLEETSTPRTLKKGDKKAETLQRVTDTIASLTLKGRKNSHDTNILGLISNFFGSPNRFEGKK